MKYKLKNEIKKYSPFSQILFMLISLLYLDNSRHSYLNDDIMLEKRGENAAIILKYILNFSRTLAFIKVIRDVINTFYN